MQQNTGAVGVHRVPIRAWQPIEHANCGRNILRDPVMRVVAES